MSGAAHDPALFRKLSWLTLFRVVTLTVLLGGTAIVNWRVRGENEAGLTPLYAVIVVSYLVSILVAVLLHRGARLTPLAWASVALDVGVAAALVTLTGGSESVFLFLFSLAIVNAAALLYRGGAVFSFVLSVVTYLAVAAGERPFPASAAFVHVGAFAATAVLAAYLAQQLRTTGARLAARESDLASLTALHEAIVQSMSGGLLTLDSSGNVTFLNRAGEQMLGRAARELHGRPGHEALPVLGERVARDEVELVNARGVHLRLGYSSFPLQDRAGGLLGTAVIFQDLTQLRAMEEAMRRSERLADLGRVAAGLAHELRNPLASLSGSIELLRDLVPVEERRLLDIALRESERLNVLVTEFLQFARPPPLRRARADLASLLGETLDVFANDPQAAGVQLERALHASPIDCDPDQIRQVAWNLLRNAAQAVQPSGGRVRVTCGPEADGVAFEVDDDGPGIAPEELSRLFLPFHTTKAGGSGLGLATVQRIVDAHEGRVTVESRSGEGARFRVYLRGGRTATLAPR